MAQKGAYSGWLFALQSPLCFNPVAISRAQLYQPSKSVDSKHVAVTGQPPRQHLYAAVIQ